MEKTFKLELSDEKTTEELVDLAAKAADDGKERIFICGDEPTWREDIEDMVKQLAQLPKVNKICMYTNGINLSPEIDTLKENGLNQVWLYANSMRYSRFKGQEGLTLDDLIAGINSAVKAGVDPVMIEIPVVAGETEDEVIDLVQLTLQHACSIVFRATDSFPKESIKSKLPGLRTLPEGAVDDMDYEGLEVYRYPGAKGKLCFFE